MLPFPVNPRWYEHYWMNERTPRMLHLSMMLRRFLAMFTPAKEWVLP
jgi:hypothetical protein